MGFDKDLQAALLKCALGYNVEERDTLVSDGKVQSVRVKTRHIKPDAAAIRRIQELRELGEWKEE